MDLSGAKFQKLSIGAIEQSPEIQAWVSQFNGGQSQVAKALLSHVCFVSRDEFSSWLRRSIEQLSPDEVHALYSVRKLPKDNSFWDVTGKPIVRPGSSLGSEDLVYSLISNLVRSSNGRLLDHPSLSVLKAKRVKCFVLIDDSIGSGDRVSGFINSILMHPTLLSWWSFGWIKMYVISFARTRQAEATILSNIRGSDHRKRKFRKSEKLEFISEIVYDIDWYEARWGEQYAQIINLCQRQTQIHENFRLGYGGIMAHIVFYHSVPNNLPGVLWKKNKKWQGLMPGCAVPDWLLALLDQLSPGKVGNTPIPDILLKLLALVKRGVRSVGSVATRLGIDHQYTNAIINHATELGFLTPQLRFTSAGLDRLVQSKKIEMLPKWDHNMYIPSSWCAGRATVQPLTNESSIAQRLADSVEALVSADGDVGQTSLVRSDAKTATPSLSLKSHLPSVSRMRIETSGPKGSKER